MTLHGRTAEVYSKLVVVLAALLVAGCGANNASPSSDEGSCSSEIASLTPDQIRKHSGAQIDALGTSIRCLSDAALGALSGNSLGGNGQIYAITAEQIAVLTPAQVRMLGATGDGGAVATSKIASL